MTMIHTNRPRCFLNTNDESFHISLTYCFRDGHETALVVVEEFNEGIHPKVEQVPLCFIVLTGNHLTKLEALANEGGLDACLKYIRDFSSLLAPKSEHQHVLKIAEQVYPNAFKRIPKQFYGLASKLETLMTKP